MSVGSDKDVTQRRGEAPVVSVIGFPIAAAIVGAEGMWKSGGCGRDFQALGGTVESLRLAFHGFHQARHSLSSLHAVASFRTPAELVPRCLSSVMSGPRQGRLGRISGVAAFTFSSCSRSPLKRRCSSAGFNAS